MSKKQINVKGVVINSQDVRKLFKDKLNDKK